MAYNVMPFYKDLVRSTHANQFGVSPDQVRITQVVRNPLRGAPQQRNADWPQEMYKSSHLFMAEHTDPHTGEKIGRMWHGTPSEHAPPRMQNKKIVR